MANIRICTKFCTACNAPSAPGWDFCGSCGRPLHQEPAETPDASVVDAPQWPAGAKAAGAKIAGAEPDADGGARADIVVLPTAGWAASEPAAESVPLEARDSTGGSTEREGFEAVGGPIPPEPDVQAAAWRTTTVEDGPAPDARTATDTGGRGSAAHSSPAAAGWAAGAPGTNVSPATEPIPALAPPVPIGAPVAVEILRSRASWLQRHQRLVRAAIGVAVAIVVAVAVSSDLGVRSRLDRTRNDLVGARSEIERTSDQLSITRGELDTTKKTLASTTSERDAVRSELDAKLAELAGLRGSLGDAQNRLNLQAGQIETLKSCLNGVSEALGYAAYEDYRSAVAALDAVEVSCDRASKMF